MLSKAHPKMSVRTARLCGRKPRIRRRLHRRFAIAGVVALPAVVLAIGLIAAWVAALVPHRWARTSSFLATAVVDRDARLLRAYATSDGRWRLPGANGRGRSAFRRAADRV